MKENTDNIIKGKIAEIIAEELFRELGFYVIRLGKENSVNPLTQLEDFITKCTGKFNLEKENYREIKQVDYLNKLPDFVIINCNGKVEFMEVKFRWNGCLYPNDTNVFELYPEANMLVVSNEVKNLPEENCYDPKDKTSKFHVWVKMINLKDNGRILPFNLRYWLKEKYGIDNPEVIKKYEDLVVKWLGNETVFKKPDSSVS